MTATVTEYRANHTPTVRTFNSRQEAEAAYPTPFYWLDEATAASWNPNEFNITKWWTDEFPEGTPEHEVAENGNRLEQNLAEQGIIVIGPPDLLEFSDHSFRFSLFALEPASIPQRPPL